MLISTDTNILEDLRARLSLSIYKPAQYYHSGNSASVALSESGLKYWGGKVESDTNLLDIASEQSALLLAMQYGDFGVREVVSLTDAEAPSVSPLTLKILADWSMRTKKPLSYRLLTSSGDTFFSTDDCCKTLPSYVPLRNPLTLSQIPLGPNWRMDTGETHAELKRWAIHGLERGFHNYDGATAYGVAVRTRNNTVYYTSQYSSPDRRLGIHAEVAGIVSAFMHGEQDIVYLGLVSPKFKTNPCLPCGACRQFIAEFSKKLNWNIRIVSFASESETCLQYPIEDLIPHLWVS